jgi:hypothetical protein
MGFWDFFRLNNQKTDKVSDAEWEHLYKTNFEEFWKRVVEEYDLSKLPTYMLSMRDDTPLYGDDARNCLLSRLKWVIVPSENECDRKWNSLFEIKRELEEKARPVYMLDAIRVYESRYIRY